VSRQELGLQKPSIWTKRYDKLSRKKNFLIFLWTQEDGYQCHRGAGDKMSNPGSFFSNHFTKE
jgi:hypothetical protein